MNAAKNLKYTAKGDRVYNPNAISVWIEVDGQHYEIKPGELKRNMTEKELFPPVRDLFVKRGYKVNAEVRDCDVTATKDDEFIINRVKEKFIRTLWHKV